MPPEAILIPLGVVVCIALAVGIPALDAFLKGRADAQATQPVSPQEQERLSQWLREETRRLEDETIYHDARIKAEMKRLEFLDVQKLGEKYPPNAGSAR